MLQNLLLIELGYILVGPNKMFPGLISGIVRFCILKTMGDLTRISITSVKDCSSVDLQAFGFFVTFVPLKISKADLIII